MIKQECLIAIIGCDDKIQLKVKLNKQEYKLFKKLSKDLMRIRESHCQPKLFVTDKKTDPDSFWYWDVETKIEKALEKEKLRNGNP